MIKGLNVSYQNGKWEIKSGDTVIDCITNLIFKASATDNFPIVYLECRVDKLSFESLTENLADIIIFTNKSFDSI